MDERILIVGTGALATYFAAHLSAAGIPVHIVGRWKDGLRVLQKNGAGVTGFGNFPVQVVESDHIYEKFQLALVLVKSWQTQEAAADLSKYLDKEGLAITLQNGLGNDEILSRVLGKERVGRGVTTLGVTLEKPGVVRLGGEGCIFLEKNRRSLRMEDKLRKANFQVKVVTNLTSHQWGKLVVNSAINPVSAVLGVKNGILAKNRYALALMSDLALESAKIALAMGIKLPYINPMTATVATLHKTSENISSMLQDIRRGSSTEIDFINGAIVEAGKRVRLSTPNNQAMVKIVKAVAQTRVSRISGETG